MQRKVSYAQNAEDIRVWRAFASMPPEQVTGLRYVDVGANEPRHLSITASLYDLGWRGLLIEADPALAADLRRFRPRDIVIEKAAAAGPGELTFYRVPGTGLGTLDAAEAEVARGRGFEVTSQTVTTESLDSILSEHAITDIHFMTIDVEGAESIVLSGLSLETHRPWILCIEAVMPGTQVPSHEEWEPRLLASDYSFAAFDGINRWYVANEHSEILDSVSLGLNALDIGVHGWIQETSVQLEHAAQESHHKNAWQRELILNHAKSVAPTSEYEKQILELRVALASVEGSRSWKYTRKIGKAIRSAKHRARVGVTKLPTPIQTSLIRARHHKHVSAKIGELIDPAYLGAKPEFTVGWITPEGLPPLPSKGFDLTPLSPDDVSLVREWLESGPYDTDELLGARMDNHDDELGRVLAGLQLRIALASTSIKPTPATGAKVLFDARSLQSAAFGARGIGRFASSALEGARATLGDDKIVLLVDRALEMLPESLAGTCEQVTMVSEAAVGRYSVLVQPSPMTSSPAPLVPLLHSSAHKIAIVFDFIPMHYPSVYLSHAGSRVEYAASLDALGFYDEFVCISHMVAAEVGRVLGRSNLETSVAWPANVGIEAKTRPGAPTGPIVIMTGDEGRKNTYGALAAIALATAGQEAPRDVLVIGMAGQETRVHHWSIHAAMRPGEAVTADRLGDAELRNALNTASVVLVPSFDEGLSLPVIEALASGANVVASDIPAHRELIGSGSYLVDPKNLKKFAKVIRKYAGTRRSYPRQVTKLMGHDHRQLETVIGQSALRNLGKTGVGIPASRAYIAPGNFSVGMATPWPPQRSGVADYSEAVGVELNKLCDLTVYTTADAQVGHGIKSGRISDVRAHGSSHDAFVSVIGNSHFHLPMIDLLGYVDSAAILHDTRMIEFYAALRGRGGAEQLMVRGQASRVITPAFDEQLNDLRLLQNAGMWEIAQQAKPLIMHSTISAPRIQAETGVVPQMLPFANYRSPSEATITEEMREAARNRLGLDPSVKHIASFGFIDIRTKLSDVIVEAAAWLSQWGHDVHLHLVGSATAPIAEELQIRARQAGLSRFTITGYVTDEQYRDYVLAIDVGLQLRISQFLGVAGALSDMAAYGTTAMGSHGLAVDVDTPPYIDRLPDEVSPLMVAEALEYRLANPVPAAEREEQRQVYLEAKSPRRYAASLIEILRAS